jgi:hypothetical protein
LQVKCGCVVSHEFFNHINGLASKMRVCVVTNSYPIFLNIMKHNSFAFSRK